MAEEAQKVTNNFYDDIVWDVVAYNKIDKAAFEKLKARHNKLYASFLGKKDEFTFFLFKPLKWPEFRDIRAKKLDKDNTHDYILNTCIVWPKMDAFALNEIDAGMALTLVYQILIMSNFFKDPAASLEYVLEVK